VISFLRGTEIGRRFRERGQEKNDSGGSLIPRLEVAMRKADDGHCDVFSSVGILYISSLDGFFI
jgi:hypothetical protein